MPELTNYEIIENQTIFTISNHKKFNDSNIIADSCNKLALFDLDDTLLKFVFSNSKESSFRFLYPRTKEMLQALYSKNYFIAILSNQMNLIDKNNLIEKIKWIMEESNVPILFVAALGRDFYRKPAPGMYDYINKKYFFGSVDKNVLDQSFYVGDAAGRKNKIRKDHSDCDLKLAYNIGSNFYTPDDFFSKSIDAIDSDNMKNIKKYELRKIDIKSYKCEVFVKVKSKTQRVIFVYGKGQYSGKTFFANKYFPDCEIVRAKPTNNQAFDYGKKSIFENFKKKSKNIYDIKDFIFFDNLDIHFIKQYIHDKKIDVSVYFLDYEDDICRWLKVFSELTGKITQSPQKKIDFKKFKGLYASQNIDINIIKFNYDDTKYNKEMRKVADLIL